MDQALIPSPFLDAASDQKLDMERPGNEARAFPEVHIQKGEGTIIIITINISQLQKLQHLDYCSLVPRSLVGETIINSLGTTKLEAQGEAQGDKRSAVLGKLTTIQYTMFLIHVDCTEWQPVLIKSSIMPLICPYNLVPRPSHCPVFDRLQYAKTEGEGLVSFIT